MKINSIGNFSAPSFQKRYVDKSNMSSSQKELYEDFIEPKLYSDTFSGVSHKLDDNGIDVHVKPFREDSLKILLKKGNEVYRNDKGMPIIQYFLAGELAGIASRFSSFKKDCLNTSKTENIKALAKLEESRVKPFDEESDLEEFEIEGDDIPDLSAEDLRKAEKAFLNDIGQED